MSLKLNPAPIFGPYPVDKSHTEAFVAGLETAAKIADARMVLNRDLTYDLGAIEAMNCRDEIRAEIAKYKP